MLKSGARTNPGSVTGTGPSEGISLNSTNKDPYDKRPASADQIFLKNTRSAMLNHPNMPVQGFLNLLRNLYGTNDSNLDLNNAGEIKNHVEESFKQIWDHSIKLLGDEISGVIAGMDLVSSNPTMSDDKHLLEAKTAAAAIVRQIKDGEYAADRHAQSNDLLTNLENLHDKLTRLITTYKHSHPALAHMRLDQSTPHSEQTITNITSRIKGIFAEGFREYRSLFEAIEKIDLQCRQLQFASGMDQQLIRELSAKWSVKQIGEAAEFAKKLGLSERNLYYVLKSGEPNETGHARALGLLDEISEFARSLTSIEARLPQLSPIVSPSNFSNAEDLALAAKRIKSLRMDGSSLGEVNGAVKRTVAVEAVRKLLLEMERQSRQNPSAPLIDFEQPHNVALLLVYSYANKVDNNNTCLLHDSRYVDPYRIDHDYTRMFDAKYGVNVKSQMWVSFQELLRAKILILSRESKFNPTERSSQSSTWSSLAQRISNPADRYFLAIKKILKSIDKEDSEFIRAIISGEELVSNREAGAGRAPEKRGKKPKKDFDVLGCLDQIGETLKALEGVLSSHKAVGKKDKINTLVTKIDRYLDDTEQAHALPSDELKKLLEFIKAPYNPNKDYLKTASFALDRAKILIIADPSTDERIQRESSPSKSYQDHGIQASAIIPSLNRPDVIGHQLNDILSELSAEFIAALYTRKRFETLSNLDMDRADSDEKIRASFNATLISYFRTDEFTISVNNGLYIVTILADPDVTSDTTFLQFCEQMAVDIGSDLPFVISVIEAGSAAPPYLSLSDESQGHTSPSATTDTGLIPISLSVNDQTASARYQPDLESVVQTIKQTLKLKPESTWLDVSISEDKIILKPKIPLPRSAIFAIIDKLCLLQTPIYLDQPQLPDAPISWQEVKSIIKLMLSPSDTITKFKSDSLSGRAILEIYANPTHLESLNEELSTLTQTLKGVGLHLIYETKFLSAKFFQKLSRFSPRAQISLLKWLDPSTREVNLKELISLNRVKVEKFDLSDVLQRYKDLTNPIDVSGPHVWCIDSTGTRIAEDAFSAEVCGNIIKFGIHVVNGAFIVPPESVNRQIAYERLATIYGDSREHHYMLPDLVSAGFSASRYVPSISMFIEIPITLLEEGSFKGPTKDISVTLRPSVTKVGLMAQYSESTHKFVNEGNREKIDRLEQLARFIAGASPNTSEQAPDLSDVSNIVMELLRYFNHQVADYLTKNEQFREESRTENISRAIKKNRNNLYSKPLRHAGGLIGQHQLMAHWGYYSPIGNQQLAELNNRMKKHFAAPKAHQASLQLIAEINQLLDTSELVVTAASHPDEAGRVVVELGNSLAITRRCLARPSATTTPQAKPGENIQVTNLRYNVIADCFILEY
jgi:hypothetical protein